MSPDPQLGGNNISEWRLKWGMWFVTHRALLKKIGYWLLIAVAVIAWAYTLWGLADYYFIRGLDLDHAIARDVAVARNPRQPILQRQAAKPIQIAEVYLLATAGGTYDAAARVVNPNPRWLATIEYALEVPGAAVEVLRTVLLPGRDRWLVRLNAESKANPSSATLTIRKVDWQFLSHLDVADPKRFIDERLNIEIQKPVFIPPRELALGSGTPVPSAPTAAPSGPAVNVSRAAFTVANRSAYELRDLELTVLLRRGSALVGMNRIVLNDVRSGEERAAAATWFHSIGLVQAVDVIPYVNVFDPKSFLEL